MGFTQREFFRPFAAAIAPYTNQTSGNVITVDCGSNGSLSITLGEEQVRAIALMRIPYMDVTFEYTNMSADFRNDFMQRFDMYYQRGGG